MLDRSRTPSIAVTIGRHTHLYCALITTAPTELDSPTTITLLADSLLELSCYAEDPFSLDTTRSQYAARLVLVDSLHCDWQCAKYEGNGHLPIAADPRLAGFDTLQQLLHIRPLDPVGCELVGQHLSVEQRDGEEIGQ